jgi:hypothetical protein
MTLESIFEVVRIRQEIREPNEVFAAAIYGINW